LPRGLRKRLERFQYSLCSNNHDSTLHPFRPGNPSLSHPI
jgi:hypothetical protein